MPLDRRFKKSNVSAMAQMPALTRIATASAGCLLAAIILLLPALHNGFPLLEYDTGGYLARWFEGTLAASRSTTYGLFLAAGSSPDFWPIVAAQAAAAIWVVGILLKTHRVRAYPAGVLAFIAVLAATTALPWLASELLTDIFAGLAVLAFHALVWQRNVTRPSERAALVAFIAFAASTHSATFAVVLALAAVACIVWLCNRKPIPGTAAATGVLAVALGAIMLLAGNYVVAKRIAWTPGGYGIVFARMLQDGIVARYLEDHCPDARLKLCPYRHQLPRNADEFLWANDIFDRLGRFDGLGDEMRTIVLESLRDYPVMQIKAAAIAMLKQLVAVRTGEGIGTDIGHTYWAIGHFTPAAGPAMHGARQQRGGLSFTAVNAVHRPVAWASMALLPVLVVLGLCAVGFADIGRLAATAALAILANAAVCGIISNPHDRYGSRIVWIAAFVAALFAWRGIVLARSRGDTLKRGNVSTA
jgi:hypothetical protein